MPARAEPPEPQPVDFLHGSRPSQVPKPGRSALGPPPGSRRPWMQVPEVCRLVLSTSWELLMETSFQNSF